MQPDALTDSLEDYKSSMTSIDGMTDYKFDINSSNADMIVDKFETGNYDVILQSGTSGKHIKFDVSSMVSICLYYV